MLQHEQHKGQRLYTMGWCWDQNELYKAQAGQRWQQDNKFCMDGQIPYNLERAKIVQFRTGKIIQFTSLPHKQCQKDKGYTLPSGDNQKGAGCTMHWRLIITMF